MRRTLSLCAGIVFASCQTYELQPVNPLVIVSSSEKHQVVARGLKPNVMLLVDKSGSMNTPLRAGDAACRGCGATVPCPSGCATRLSELQAAMGAFLSAPTPVARFGMTLFPSDQVCGGPGAVTTPLPPPAATDTDLAPLIANAQDVRSKIDRLAVDSADPAYKVIGGTPTGPSLRFVGALPSLRDDADNRSDIVILLTDGAPNCNPNNPINCNVVPRPPADQCYAGMCDSTFCSLGYLDRSGSVAAVAQLAASGIRTIVVGFGADFASPVALTTLNELAVAGEYGRTCPDGNDGECGAGGRCLPGGVCEKRFYAASNAAELGVALARISELLKMNPCTLAVADAPKDERFVSVLVEGTPVARGPETWRFQDGKIEFLGMLCERVKQTTASAPLDVEVRVANTL